MRLILSCIHDVNSVTDKDHLLLILNTETSEIDWVKLNIPDRDDIIGSKALCVSGNYLIVSLKTKDKFDKLIVIDVVNKKNTLTTCLKSKDIHSMVSVFRGRVYCISTGTDSMTNLVLSPSSNNVIRDVNHYTFDEGGSDVFHFNSLINWNRRWYVSCFGKNWKDDITNGAIIELSKNNRIVYSNINQPNSLFFNRNDEICFCESGKELFHFGKNIINLGGYTRGAIEDRENCGYWVAVSSDRKDIPLLPSRLLLVKYNGLVDKEIIIDKTYDIYNMVKAEGYLSKLL